MPNVSQVQLSSVATNTKSWFLRGEQERPTGMQVVGTESVSATVRVTQEALIIAYSGAGIKGLNPKTTKIQPAKYVSDVSRVQVALTSRSKRFHYFK